ENRHITNYSVSSLGDVLSVTTPSDLSDPLIRKTTFTYAHGLIKTVTTPDPDGPGTGPDHSLLPLTTTYVYQNETGQGNQRADLVAEIDLPDGNKQAILYDSADRPVTLTDELGRVTTIAYDDFDRPIRVTGPDPDGPNGHLPAPVTEYHYNANGELYELVG